MVRCVGQHAVIAPTALTGKRSDRQQFDGSDALRDQLGEMSSSRCVRAFRREGANMQLIDDSLFPGPPLPAVVLPLEVRGIDNDAGALDALRVAARGGIRDYYFIVDAVAVPIADRESVDLGLLPAIAVVLHTKTARRRVRSFELQLDALSARRPQTKVSTAVGLALRPEGRDVCSFHDKPD